MADFTITGPHGADAAAWINDIFTSALPTIGDAIYAGNIVKTRIIERTANGVDVDGQPFQALSDPYAKRKEKALGHANADLFGFLAHPHMMNAIEVHAGGTVSADGGLIDDLAPIDSFSVGIYGEDGEDESVRATAHNEGQGHMPRRHFFDANAADKADVEQGMQYRATIRALAKAQGR